MTYADYSFYYDTFNGRKISCENFNVLAMKASAILDTMTFNRIVNVSDDISMAVCAIAESMYKHENSGAERGIASERIGDLDVSYRSDFSSIGTKAAQDYRRTAMLYIKDKTLFYRGRKHDNQC